MFNFVNCVFELSHLLSGENRSPQYKDTSFVLPCGFTYFLCDLEQVTSSLKILGVCFCVPGMGR